MATSPEPQREMFQRKMGRFKPSKNWFENTSFSSSPLRPFPSPLAKSKQSPVGHRCYFQSSHGASTSYVGGQRPVGIGKDNNSSSRHHFDTTEDTNLPVNYLSRDSTKIRSGITQKHTSPKRSGLVQGWESFQQQDCMNLREKVQQQHRSRSPWRPLSQESVWKNTSCELTATQKLDKMLHRIRTIAASPRKAPIRDPILDEFLRKRRSKRSNYLRDSNAPSTSQVYQQGSLLAGTGSSMLRELKASSIESFDSPGMLNSTPSKTMSPFPWGCSKLRPAWPSRQAAPASPRDKGSFVQQYIVCPQIVGPIVPCKSQSVLKLKGLS